MSEIKQIDEDIEIIVAEGQDRLSLSDFTDKIESIRLKHTTSTYNSLSVYALHKKGAGALVLAGSRDETDAEEKERGKKEAIERSRVERAEMKEFLRLKKKFGKKNSEK